MIQLQEVNRCQNRKTGCIEVLSAGPGTTIQDRGRPGFLSYGLSEGGAMDTYALAEGAALLGNDTNAAAIEIFGFGGRFRLRDASAMIALTGARFRATLDGTPMRWRASHRWLPDTILEIGACEDQGSYGYLQIEGGIDVAPVLGSRSTNARAGIGGMAGRPLAGGDNLPVGAGSSAAKAGMHLPEPEYFNRRTIRVCKGAQAHLYTPEEFQRFLATPFTISDRRDRMGLRLEFDAEPFHTEAGLTSVSDSVVRGDIQIAGDGIPTVLMADRQATGGYPRIATVITADIAAISQMPTGTQFSFVEVSLEEAVEALRQHTEAIKGLVRLKAPLVRDPATMTDLLAYQLVSGAVVTGDWLPWDEERTNRNATGP